MEVAFTLSGFVLVWLLVLALIDRDSPHARRSHWVYSQIIRWPYLRIAIATALIALLFTACESKGVINIISGSPEEVAQAFLTDLSQGREEAGWRARLPPTTPGGHWTEVTIAAARGSEVAPFKFEVLRILRDETYLAQVNVWIEFDRRVERWPVDLDRIFKGKFTTAEGRSSFRGYFLLGKEGFRWWIYGCCG